MDTEIRQDTGYGLVPRKVMRDKNLSSQAKAVYAYLASFAGNTGKAFPSTDLMANELGISRNTLFKYLKELRELGAITVERETTEYGIKGKNIYYLHNEIQTSRCTKKRDIVKRDIVKRYTVNEDTNSNSINNNSINSNRENTTTTQLTKNNKEEIIKTWNELNLQQLRAIKENTNRHTMLKARIEEYSFEEVIEAIKRINKSSFLKGQNNNNWVITFDWLVRPNNFLKVLEGNYDDKGVENFGTNRKLEKEDEFEFGIEI